MKVCYTGEALLGWSLKVFRVRPVPDRAETGHRISHHTAECPSHQVSRTISLALCVQLIQYLEVERGKSPNSKSKKQTELI